MNLNDIKKAIEDAKAKVATAKLNLANARATVKRDLASYKAAVKEFQDLRTAINGPRKARTKKTKTSK